jgi:glutaminase
MAGSDLPGGPAAAPASTGQLPDAPFVQLLLEEAVERARRSTEGEIAEYIAALSHADPEQVGACIVATIGRQFLVGDADDVFSIQSVAKPFVFVVAVFLVPVFCSF